MGRKLPKPRRSFVRTEDVLNAANVSFVTLRDWIKRGILPEPLPTPHGRGNLAKYPLSAVPRAELARRLRDDGWALGEIAEHMRKLEWENGQSSEPDEPEE